MAIGEVMLALGLVDKDFKNGLSRVEKQLSNSMKSMKNIIQAAALGKYLFSGAAQAAQEEFDLVTTRLSILKNEMISEEMLNGLNGIIEKFDYLGKGASTTSVALAKFIQTGKATGLETLGIYLTKTEKDMLSAMDATERFNWVLKEMPNRIDEVNNSLSAGTKMQMEFKKKSDDLKKALGTAFVGVLTKIVDAFGGVENAMKAAIIAFTAYKTAMIIGNVAIGISKAIAMGSVFSAPVAIAMGVGALAAIGGLIGAAGLAVSAINNMQTPDAAKTNNQNQNLNAAPNQIVIIKDKYGQVEKVIDNSNGGNSTSVQTNYGN